MYLADGDSGKAVVWKKLRACACAFYARARARCLVNMPLVIPSLGLVVPFRDVCTHDVLVYVC